MYILLFGTIKNKNNNNCQNVEERRILTITTKETSNSKMTRINCIMYHITPPLEINLFTTVLSSLVVDLLYVIFTTNFYRKIVVFMNEIGWPP